ncbi:MAG: YraN family protein [Pseudomonadota bacterium]
MSFHGGVAAETIAEAAYSERGYKVLQRRWRGEAGEIDLILRRGDVFCFVEVKKARNHGQAAERLGPQQQARIQAAALEFLGNNSLSLDCEMQFDVALVDGVGRLKIIAAAFH